MKTDERPINLSILDFKGVRLVNIDDNTEPINLSILDFKAANVEINITYCCAYKSIHIGF